VTVRGVFFCMHQLMNSRAFLFVQQQAGLSMEIVRADPICGDYLVAVGAGAVTDTLLYVIKFINKLSLKIMCAGNPHKSTTSCSFSMAVCRHPHSQFSASCPSSLSFPSSSPSSLSSSLFSSRAFSPF